MSDTTNARSDRTVLDIIREARALVARLAIEQIPPFVATWPEVMSVDRECPPSFLPVLRWIDDLPGLAEPATGPLTRLLTEAASSLQWRQSYRKEDFGAGFLERYGWSELIGSRGPVANDRIAVGFLMLGPDVHYPEHSHDAEEIYLPLAGEAEWRRGNEAWRKVKPGTPIHHSSRLVHATRTLADPLLALYLWRGGDLAQKPSIGRVRAASARGA
jgi:hypothetical protein